MKKKFLVTAMAAVILSAAGIMVLLSSPVGVKERKPDENGHYILTIPKFFDSDRAREYEVWGTSCEDLRGRDLGPKGTKISHGYPRPEEKLFCFPPVDNITDFLKNGEVEPGEVGFKNGPLLLPDGRATSSDEEIEKLKQKGKENALRFYGPLPPDAFWVYFGKRDDGYIRIKNVVPCPKNAPKADFCILIDNYAFDVSNPKIDDLYGVYCWENCDHLKDSPQAFRGSILFGGGGHAELVLKEGYAMPLWRMRQDSINRIKQTTKGE